MALITATARRQALPRCGRWLGRYCPLWAEALPHPSSLFLLRLARSLIRHGSRGPGKARLSVPSERDTDETGRRAELA